LVCEKNATRNFRRERDLKRASQSAIDQPFGQTPRGGRS
jgi:hypothetical protein